MTEPKTLFTFLLPGLKRREFDSFGSVLLQGVQRGLMALGFPKSATLAPVFFGSEVDGVQYVKTVSRQVLGCMNDLALIATYHIRVDGGLDSFDRKDLTRRLNRNPLRPLKYNAVDALQQLLDEGQR